MKKLISLLLAAASLAVMATPSLAADKVVDAKAPAASQAPLLTPEALEKIKAHLAELHTARIKILNEGKACVEAAKSAEAVQQCLEQEQAAVNGQQQAPKAAKPK